MNADKGDNTLAKNTSAFVEEQHYGGTQQKHTKTNNDKDMLPILDRGLDQNPQQVASPPSAEGTASSSASIGVHRRLSAFVEEPHFGGTRSAVDDPSLHSVSNQVLPDKYN